MRMILASWLMSLGMLMVATPILTTPNGRDFTITYDAGAIWACTYYQRQVVTEEDKVYWPDGKYTPAHCWSLDPASTSYDDDWAYINVYDSDWLIHASVGYPNPHTNDMTYLDTNTVKAHR